ncbi:MAG: hypothetical protein D6753_00870 [Planctomycetota bacterium]|nr:MAG: hypothetical protein D6753_00870 [Planctomycetota bacterium]
MFRPADGTHLRPTAFRVYPTGPHSATSSVCIIVYFRVPDCGKVACMDWIDPKYRNESRRRTGSKRSGRSATQPGSATTKTAKPKTLESHIRAVVAQPSAVWGEAYEHALMDLPWPASLSAELTFEWATVAESQARALVRAGIRPRKLAAVMASHWRQADGEHIEDSRATDGGSTSEPIDQCAFQWIDAAPHQAEAALGLAGLLWQIPTHAAIAENTWLGEWLETLVDSLGSLDVLGPQWREQPAVCPLVLQCEIPLLLAAATSPPRRVALREASRAMDNLAGALEVSVDDPAPWLMEGAIHLRAGLASVLRCRVLGDALGLRQWYGPQRKALARLLAEAARWSRASGTQLLGTLAKPPRSRPVWEHLTVLARASRSVRTAMAASGLVPPESGRVNPELLESKLGPAPCYSETAETACLRVDWTHKSGRVAVDFSGPHVAIEVLGPKGDPLLAGDWQSRIQRDGRLLQPDDPWREVCWFTDDDVAYLELECGLDEQARLQRQIMLLRQERLLFLSDALLGGDETDQWSLETHLPLAPGAAWQPEERSTEGRVRTRRGISLALPLFLPEWNRQLAQEGGWGGVCLDGDSLCLVQHRPLRNLYTPLILSLDNKHASRPYTWRRLTVARDLQIVPPDEAAAYRVQIGKQQWLFYRSLDPPARRTALGMHTIADFYAGRFDADERMPDTIIEVEPQAES